MLAQLLEQAGHAALSLPIAHASPAELLTLIEKRQDDVICISALLDVEVGGYFDILVRGISIEQARRRAKLDMGGVEQVVELLRIPGSGGEGDGPIHPPPFLNF